MTTMAQVFLVLCLYVTLYESDASRFATHERNVLRHNHGVTFEPIDTFTVVHGYWLHTFGFSLPERPHVRGSVEINCTRATHAHGVNETHCAHVKPFIDSFSEIETEMTRRLVDALVTVERLVPIRGPPPTRRRHTRSWIPIIGRFLKTSIGTATESDIANLRKAIDELRRNNIMAYDQFAKTEDTIASTMHLANRRMDALQQLVNDQRRSGLERYKQLSNSLDDLYSFSSIVPVALTRITRYAHSLVQVYGLRTAISDALHARLSTYIISFSHMAAAMHRMNLELGRIHPSFRLAHATVAEAFQITDFIVSRVNRDIYITIKFPVTTIHEVFTLYKLRVFPVAMPNNETHITMLETKIKGLGYSRRIPYYMAFTEMPRIRQHMLDMATTPDMLTDIRTPSCVTAIFMNIPPLIHSQCSFHLYTDTLKPSVYMLDAATVLFINVTNITRTCIHTNTVQLPKCLQCVYRLPCRCSYTTELAFIPPSIENCGPLISNRTQRPNTHVTNLAVLSQFFSADELGVLASNTFLQHPVSANLPPFQTYEHNNSQTLAVIDDTKFQLRKAINLSISRKIAYRSMADFLSHKESMDADPADNSWSTNVLSPSYNSCLLFISLALSGIALVSSVVVSIKLRALSVLLVSSKCTAAAVPTHFDFYRTVSTISSTTVEVTTSSDNIIFSDVAVLISAICSLLLILLIVCYVAYECYFRRQMLKPTTKIFMQLNLDKTSLYLHFMTLKDDISCYTFSSNASTHTYKIIGNIFPYLSLDWPDLKIWHAVLGKAIPLPHHIALSRNEAQTLRQFLQKNTRTPVPLFYSYKTRASHPKPIHVIADRDTPHHAPTAPTMHSGQNMEMQHLYPII